MEVAGAAFPITPLLTICTKIVTILHNVGKKFKRAPLMMTSIATECSLIHVALAQLRSFDWSSVSAYADGRQEQMTRVTESIILGCTLTLSVIEEYAIELQDYVDGSPLSPTEQMGIMARVRVLWKEEEMRELLLQLRGYQTGLTNLIRAAHDSDFNDPNDTLSGAGSNFGTLLQRSRSSRARKPLSIRAAMQQAVTYSNIARTPTSSSSHSTNPSISTTQSRQSTTASSVSATTTSPVRHSSIQPLSAITADLYDGAANATANKKLISDNARRKRPAFLTLQPEEGDTLIDGRHLHTKKDKDNFRKSSPTVGESFTFVPGEPPPEHTLPITPKHLRQNSQQDEPAKSEEVVQVLKHEKEQEQEREPPQPEPPSAPLPKIPSRSPSRAESPIVPPKIPARAPSRGEVPRFANTNGRIASPSPPKQPSVLDEQLEQSIAELEEENRKSQSPSPPQLETRIPPPPTTELPTPRRQKSTSSVRSQIIALPETARLRKQASAELLREKRSAEFLANKKAEEFVPALPSTGFVRGNAFGRQGSHSSLQVYPRIAPPRTSSLEGLSERNRKRSATDLAQHTGANPTPIPLRPRRAVQRSASDAQRPPNLRFPLPPAPQDGDNYSPTTTSIASPSSSHVPTSADSESWPLTPENGHHTEYSHHRNLSPQYLHPGDQSHSRNTSAESSTAAGPSRTLSPDQTPRASRTSTPYSGTPRTGRSRTNTLMTIASEAPEREQADDSISMAGSVAPSVMSAQWFRTPRERLGLGTRMSRSEVLPWELGAHEDQGPPVPPKPKTPPKVRKGGVAGVFSVFPPRAPSRMREEQNLSDSPPRSPLLTEKFLVDVKAGLPEDVRRKPSSIDPPPRPSTSMKSRDGASTPEWSRKKQKKEKEKKEGRFPTLGDMFSEYKNMGNSWYTSQYAQAAEEQRLEKEGKRPATGSTTLSSSSKAGNSMEAQASSSNKSQRTMVSTPRPSGDMASSTTSSSGSSKKDKEKDKKKKKSSNFPTMKELWSEYKSSTNAWYTSPYSAEEARDIATPQSHFS